MDAMMSASREFFRQPIDEKRRYTDLVDGERFEDHLEGYGSEQLTSKDQTSLDWSDRLYLKVEPQGERSLRLWPESFRDVLHEYSVQCSLVKERLVSAMARLLGLDEDHFLAEEPDDRATTYARIIYYPPCPRPDLVLGVKPHSDATLITILMANDHDVGGLQVLRDDDWYNVLATLAPHALLISVGDMMEIMSNGIFKSPVHRVVTNASKGRTSVVMFYGPDLDKEIGPADQLIDNRRPARYKRVKVKDYVHGLFQNFSRGARVIDTVRI
ncbi:protein SRG1-like [Lolium rigidum]|uniref:protein SRG1-like n=1 Tax=Lolium rigidum TaxID=89674 RepID=UPI001F5CCA4E|nr:protein SRG1-like [Lolium rigidum]